MNDCRTWLMVTLVGLATVTGCGRVVGPGEPTGAPDAGGAPPGGDGDGGPPPDGTCTTNAECAGFGLAKICDLGRGRCVECLTTSNPNDGCGIGFYCSAEETCVIGCKDDAACQAVNPGLICDSSRHLCIDCVPDAGEACPRYTTCDPSGGVPATCVPTCANDTQCPTGWKCCGTQCHNLQLEVNHCGDCGTVCTLPHRTVSCVEGACRPGACDANYADCVPDSPDDASTQGCETPLLADNANCGGCAQICASPLVCRSGLCAPADCTAGYANCDQDPLGTCETNLSADAANCGACGLPCSSNHGFPSCANGGCEIACDSNYANCDHDVANGCEAALSSDVNHCGSCDVTCRNVRGTTQCVSGHCTPTCSAGSQDCDLNPTNGCEDVTSDVNNCGACGQACTLPNATPVCQQVACRIGACLIGFSDCDGNPTNGCESNPLTDVNNCGACGQACSKVGGTPTCVNGVCTVNCATGSGDCNLSAADGCEVNLDSDVKNCASCGHACTCANGPPSCLNGACSCIECGDPPWANCSGNGCVNNLNTDVLNCGSCGHACTVPHGTAACVNGQCALPECDRSSSPAYGDCDGIYANGCETPLNTVTNCGECAVACAPPHATGTCSTGACAILYCETGYADCNHNPDDGCEINLSTDVNHCGGCGSGNVCSNFGGTPACRNGTCAIDCDPVHGNCDGLASSGCETVITTDPYNCGGCGNICSSINGSPVCSAGACLIPCNPGYGNCDGLASNGCEVQFATNVANCGACGHVCTLANAISTCTAGACAIQVCSRGWGDCNGTAADGCEHDLSADVNNCGGCGNTCGASTPRCVNGACVS